MTIIVAVLILAPFIGYACFRVQKAIEHRRWKKMWDQRDGLD